GPDDRLATFRLFGAESRLFRDNLALRLLGDLCSSLGTGTRPIASGSGEISGHGGHRNIAAAAKSDRVSPDGSRRNAEHRRPSSRGCFTAAHDGRPAGRRGRRSVAPTRRQRFVTLKLSPCPKTR